MKYLLITLVGMGIIIGGVALNERNVTTVVNQEVEHVEIEKEVVVDALEVKIKEAQDAARDTIQAKAQAAYDAAYEHEMKTIEAQVLKEVEAEIKTRRTSVEKETGAYWLSEANVRQLIRATFPDDPNTAVAVAMAESGLNPRATNAQDSHRGCKGSYGIFQVGCVHGYQPAALYDVETNIRIAKALYDDAKAKTGNGWAPWGAHSNGSYLAYMN